MQDVDSFLDQIRNEPGCRAFLDSGGASGPVVVARAPGRLDVMGGVGDYSGALVAEATIGEAALVAIRHRSDSLLRIRSVGIDRDGYASEVEIPLSTLLDGGKAAGYDVVRLRLTADAGTRWAAYVAGCLYTLIAESKLGQVTRGANILLNSAVPLGAGVSSSAAIEVATMQALNALYDIGLGGIEVATLAQRVENRVVGAPCGIMDQMTSAVGVADSLLRLVCRPHDVKGTLTIPKDVRILGIDSAVKHSVGGGAYTRARVAAFMGRKILGLAYLTDLSPAEYRAKHARTLPSLMEGAEFLAEHGETGDEVTRIDPPVIYRVRAAAEHAIYENARVTKFVDYLSADKLRAASLLKAGDLMYGSHWSYTRIGLGSRETNLLVRMGRFVGAAGGIYGAKITGGGSGGTAAFLTYGDDGPKAVAKIAKEYAARTGNRPTLFAAGASPGAMEFGYRTVTI